MSSFIQYVIGFFSRDSQVQYLRNKVSHFVIEHQKARTKISDAKKAFDKVRESTVRDFENLKKNTIDKTVTSVGKLHSYAIAEEQIIEQKYQAAKDKIASKVGSITDLHNTVMDIGGRQYPLE